MKMKGDSAMKKVSVFLLFFCFWIPLSMAQTDSIDIVQEAGMVQDIADFADWGMGLLTYERKNYTLFLLPVASYEERTKLVVGVMPVLRFYLGKKKNIEQDDDTYFRPSNVSAQFLVSTTGMYEYGLESDLYLNNNWYLFNKGFFQWMPDKYYPVGNDANKDNYSEMDIKKIEFFGQLMKGITSEFFAGINYDLANNDVRNEVGGILNSTIPGFDKQNVIGVGPSLTYDNRNNIDYPTSGSFVDVSYIWYPEKLSDFAFSSLTFDARYFFKLGASKVLATQFYLKSATGNIPFYRLPVLGGKNLFRGISQPYKYMDNNSMYLQTAYRSSLWWRLGYEVFAGAGKVYHQWDSSILDQMHLMGGLGLRVAVIEKEGLSLRIDYGMSTTGDKGLFVTLGEAF